MLEIHTKRLVGFSDLILVDNHLETRGNTIEINLANLKPDTGREEGFCFYDKHNTAELICHIGITDKRGRFEVSYGTEEAYHRNGYMTEALEALCKWIFLNTDRESIWALPGGPHKEASIAVLKKCGFKKADEELGHDWYELKKDK